MKNFLLVLLWSIFSATMVYGQTGTIRGYVYEDATGDPVLYGTVQVLETGGGNTTDFDGAYSLELPVGTYSLAYSYIGLAELTVEAVEVKEGEVTNLDVRMKSDSELIEEIVIEARQVRNNEAGLATIKRRSTNLIDNVGAVAIRRSGDGDAAAAVKRVSGVSVEGGKYVFVRGLGDRYTKSCLLYTSPSPRDRG